MNSGQRRKHEENIPTNFFGALTDLPLRPSRHQSGGKHHDVHNCPCSHP